LPAKRRIGSDGVLKVLPDNIQIEKSPEALIPDAEASGESG